MRWKLTEDDVVVLTKLLNFQTFVRPEPIINHDPRPTVSALFGLRIKYLPVPVKDNGGIGIALRGTGIVPPWRGVSRPIAALGCRRPDDEWRQVFPCGGNALNSGDQLAFNRGSSVFTPISRMQHIFARGQIGQQISCLIHVVHIFWQDGRIMQYPVHECKPMCHLVINIVPRPVKWLECSCFQVVTLIELLDPILSRRSDRVIVCKDFEGRRPSTGDRPRQLSYWLDKDRMIAFGRTLDVVHDGLLRKE